MKRRLVLTTVHDNQSSVQIDLYRSSTRTMADALYIGSLVMENIKPQPKGKPSIELVITSAQNGDIAADAVDLDAKGERQTLNVSLKSMEEDHREYIIPDFELEYNTAAPEGLYERTTEIEEEEKRRFPWLLVVCAALILTAIGFVIWLFFFQNVGSPGAGQAAQGRQTERAVQAAPPSPQQPAQQQPAASQSAAQQPTASQPATSQPAAQQSAASQPAQRQPASPQQPVQTPPSAPQQAAQPTPAPAQQQAASPPPVQTPPPVIRAPAQAPASSAPVRRTRPAPPVASYNVPSVIPREGVPYRIRYGDTLWDIAEAFYRNPWLYPRIARFNNIRNPDLIISGTTIRVPPRN